MQITDYGIIFNLTKKINTMKNLVNRTVSEEKRQEIIETSTIISEEFNKSLFTAMRGGLKDLYAELGLIENKPAYSASDAMHQGFADSSRKFRKTGRY